MCDINEVFFAVMLLLLFFILSLSLSLSLSLLANITHFKIMELRVYTVLHSLHIWCKL